MCGCPDKWWKDVIDDRIKGRIVTAVRRRARVRHRSWLEKTPGGTTTIERACPILSDLKGKVLNDANANTR